MTRRAPLSGARPPRGSVASLGVPSAALRRGAVVTLLSSGLMAAALPASGVPAAPRFDRVVVTSVSGLGSGVLSATSAVKAAGGRVLDALPLVDGVTAEIPAGTVLAPSLRVTPDRSLSVSSASTAADAAVSTVRSTLGVRADSSVGRGITVAVVDTGVADVPDLADRLKHVDVTGTGKGDGFGHGTFMAGLIAGSGASSDGAYAGVAPAARVLDVKVADETGSTDLVTVLRGLQVVAEKARKLDIRVLNLSLSSGSPLPYQVDPLTQALESIWRLGVVVVVPAGNDGPGPGTIASPGVDPTLLTVGSLDEGGTPSRADDSVASYSGRGPAPQGVAKPDLVAPGNHLISLRAPGSAIDRDNPGARVEGGYFRGSGTSMATAVTSGAVAALLDARDDLSPDAVKGLLSDSTYAASGLGQVTSAGSGGLDLAGAIADSAALGKGDGRRGKSGRGRGLGDADFNDDDIAAYTALARAWADNDLKAAARAWARLSSEARAWAARAWAQLDPEARAWAARAWAGRAWADETTSSEEWLARAWAARAWVARAWAGRAWAEDDWTGRAWAGRAWAGRAWADFELLGRAWAGRAWADEDFTARAWVARAWAGLDDLDVTARAWVARAWAGLDDLTTTGRAWAGRAWAGRAWSDNDWS